MDLLSNFENGRRNYISAVTWFFSSDIRPAAGFASSRRLLLNGFHQASINRSRITFMVTGQSEAMEALGRTRPGLLIVTPKLDDGDGYSLINEARSLVSDLRTILICDRDSDDLLEARHSAADAVICEQDMLTESQPFKALVIAMSLGRRYRSPVVQAARDVSNTGDDDEGWRAGTPLLSSREQELVDLWVEGLGDRDVADRLGVTYTTVRSYGRSVRRKLGVASRAQVVLKVVKLGLSRAAGR